MFLTKNGSKYVDDLSPLLFNTALLYAIRRVQVNQDGLKLNGTHEILVYADAINILDRSVHTIKKNTEATGVASKENGLTVSAGKSKYMVRSKRSECRTNA
jgi:hypothetical protein